jgi:hypothetical protein
MVRGMHDTALAPMACALLTRLTQVRTCIETSMMGSLGDASVQSALDDCSRETIGIRNLLECIGEDLRTR